ncbi:MAG TPA: B-box zinc finger protein [Terracidiphilus sp.]|jgi:TM2 domain-containing membrane protein YozV
MDCVNHPGVSATAFCQTCGKALCAQCVRTAPGGQVLCEPCFTAWQTYQQPFVPIDTGSPNPAAAAVLGLIPGVGAMYNGQFFKGLIHVVIFAVLISMTHISGIFGLFIPAWILYQSFEAFHTAKALRDGLPVPDPLGLNDVGNWLNLGKHPQYPGQPPAGQTPTGQPFTGEPGAGSAPPSQNPWSAGAAAPPPAGAYQPPYTANPYQTAYQGQWQNPYAPPAAGPVDPNAPPQPIPPDPSAYWHPAFWRRGAPVGAIVLIALGTLFLLGQLDIFNGRLIEFSWPVFLIALGVWLVVRRLGESQGGPK